MYPRTFPPSVPVSLARAGPPYGGPRSGGGGWYKRGGWCPSSLLSLLLELVGGLPQQLPIVYPYLSLSILLHFDYRRPKAPTLATVRVDWNVSHALWVLTFAPRASQPSREPRVCDQDFCLSFNYIRKDKMPIMNTTVKEEENVRLSNRSVNKMIYTKSNNK